jgi:hypothetical protein
MFLHPVFAFKFSKIPIEKDVASLLDGENNCEGEARAILARVEGNSHRPTSADIFEPLNNFH